MPPSRCRAGSGRGCVGLGWVCIREPPQGLVVRKAGTVAAAPASLLLGAQKGGSSLNSPSGLASPFLAAPCGLAMAQRNDGATSSASTSTTERLSPSGGLPGPGLEPTDHHRPVALGQRLGDVLGQLPPHIYPEEAGVAVAPAVAVLDAGGDGQAEVGHQVAVPVWLSSGSSVRLPVMVTWVSAMAAASLAVVRVSWADMDSQRSGPHLLGPGRPPGAGDSFGAGSAGSGRLGCPAPASPARTAA
jgi:hypothetical protein